MGVQNKNCEKQNRFTKKKKKGVVDLIKKRSLVGWFIEIICLFGIQFCDLFVAIQINGRGTKFQ